MGKADELREALRIREIECQDLSVEVHDLRKEVERLRYDRSRLVIIESPFAGDYGRNLEYARGCMRDALWRGEAPFASHLLYTQQGILDDRLHAERKMGMDAGFRWGCAAGRTVVYRDLGVSEGMTRGIREAEKAGRTVEFRRIKKVPL